MSRLSYEKGQRIEREIIARHREIDVHCERVPLSGAMKYKGGIDVDVYAFGRDAPPMVSEVKSRASGEGFRLIERWIGDAEMLFLRRDYADPIVVLPWSTYTGLLDAIRRR